MLSPEGFRFHTPMTIRFADLDALGHVNNAKYLTYIETARMGYVAAVCKLENPLDVGMILAKITVEYKLPLTLGDSIDLYTRCVRIGNKSFDLETVILLGSNETVSIAASGQQVMVAYDYTRQQPIPVPADWRARMLAYDPGLQG